MNKKELIDEIKQDLWFLKTGTQNAFPINFWSKKVDRAFRKFTINSGKTRFRSNAGPSKTITFVPDDKVYYVVHVYPWNYAGEGNNESFNVFSSDHFFYYLGSHRPIDYEHLVLHKSFLNTLRAQYGEGTDFHYDEDLSTLYVNDISDAFESLVIEYLPVWSLKEDNTDEVKDLSTLDWIMEYTKLSIMTDTQVVLLFGEAFDLPTGATAFEDAKEEMLEMEKTLRLKNPLIGITKA